MPKKSLRLPSIKVCPMRNRVLMFVRRCSMFGIQPSQEFKTLGRVIFLKNTPSELYFSAFFYNFKSNTAAKCIGFFI